MKTIEALNAYLNKSGVPPYQLSRLLKFSPRAITSWSQEISPPTGERLIRLQEFLITQGYEISEVSELPDFVKLLRAAFFAEELSSERMCQELSFPYFQNLWRFLRTGVHSEERKQKCLLLLEQISQSPVVNQQSEDSSEQDGFDEKLASALLAITELGELLKSSTPKNRHLLRQKHSGIFSASNILSAACSERAFDLWFAENK